MIDSAWDSIHKAEERKAELSAEKGTYAFIFKELLQ